MRAVAMALVLALSASAWAQSPVTPPAVPQLPDEPLPEWKPPPPRKSSQALFLDLSPQMQDAQRLRQIGLWVSTVGWIQLFGAGILYVWAASVNRDIGYPGPNNPNGRFQPELEDQRNDIERSAQAFFAIGGVLAAGGFIVYTLGQWRMTVHHKSHPKDPLPPLSGF
jgi:hypothetical protein